MGTSSNEAVAALEDAVTSEAEKYNECLQFIKELEAEAVQRHTKITNLRQAAKLTAETLGVEVPEFAPLRSPGASTDRATPITTPEQPDPEWIRDQEPDEPDDDEEAPSPGPKPRWLGNKDRGAMQRFFRDWVVKFSDHENGFDHRDVAEAVEASKDTAYRLIDEAAQKDPPLIEKIQDTQYGPKGTPARYRYVARVADPGAEIERKRPRPSVASATVGGGRSPAHDTSLDQLDRGIRVMVRSAVRQGWEFRMTGNSHGHLTSPGGGVHITVSRSDRRKEEVRRDLVRAGVKLSG